MTQPQTQAIRGLVDRKIKIDQAKRAIDIFEYSSSDNGYQERCILDGMKHNVIRAQQVLDAQVAALSHEHRWQFMFECMLAGVFEDEIEFTT
jgi:hypothetical protein